MAMNVDNPDHPWAAGPPVYPVEFDAEVEMPEGLWSSVLREMDPRPVQAVLSHVRWRIAGAQGVLDALIAAEGTGGLLKEQLEGIAEMLTQASGDTYEMPGRYPNGMVESVPRELVAAVIPYLKEGDEPPDRSVGIWGNGWGALAAELELAMDGKLTCPQCGGEQYIWDEGVFLEKTAEIAKKTGEDIENVRYDGQDYGNVACPKCNGAGVVRIEEVTA